MRTHKENGNGNRSFFVKRSSRLAYQLSNASNAENRMVKGHKHREMQFRGNLDTTLWQVRITWVSVACRDGCVMRVNRPFFRETVHEDRKWGKQSFIIPQESKPQKGTTSRIGGGKNLFGGVMFGSRIENSQMLSPLC
ncbi:hypothetical protein HAX54_050465 [Datura stramonium]|uniref:Uncharacterized protein n=1 Tax=Datura stramonium TaxID=4076 RepID=A0ABS8WNS0_DATST|nr:hypothetical protein [Datura stramonium]